MFAEVGRLQKGLCFLQTSAGMADKIGLSPVRIPARGGTFESAQRFEPRLFGFDPALKTWPRAKQRLVSNLDVRSTGNYQPPFLERTQNLPSFIVEARQAGDAPNGPAALIDLCERWNENALPGCVSST